MSLLLLPLFRLNGIEYLFFSVKWTTFCTIMSMFLNLPPNSEAERSGFVHGSSRPCNFFHGSFFLQFSYQFCSKKSHFCLTSLNHFSFWISLSCIELVLSLMISFLAVVHSFSWIWNHHLLFCIHFVFFYNLSFNFI